MSQITEALCRALKNSDVNAVKNWLDNGGDLNMQDNNGYTPLHIALFLNIQDNNENFTPLEKTTVLMRRTLMLNKLCCSPLHCVLKLKKDKDCLKEPREWPNNLEVVKWLIAGGADLDMQDKHGNTPLNLALALRGYVTARLLMDSGANVNVQNKRGRSPLHCIVNNQAEPQDKDYTPTKLQMITWLLDAGADLDMQDNNGNTPLSLAVRGKSSVTARLLLDRGANVNIQDNDGHTPLHLASMKKNSAIIFLLDSGTINVNVQDKKGRTPVHLCVLSRNAEHLSIMLDRGGSMLVENRDGKTPLHYLSQEGGPLLNRCLVQYIQRIKCAGLVNDVDVLNVHVDDDADYQSDLLNELELMKQDKVGWSTVHHVFSRYQDPLYVDNSDLNAAIDSPECENKYLRYGKLLKTTFAKAKKRKVILDRAVNCFKIPIPVETIRKILCFLDYGDLLSLVTSYERQD